jgi:hypothetical protein
MMRASNRHLTKVFLTLVSALALSLGRATTAAAAIDGSFTIAQGQPGDRVTLTAQGPAGQTQTVYLISISEFDRQVAGSAHQVCGTSGQHALGPFTWKGSLGSLTFTIPNVPAGRYYFQVQVRNVSPDCWRIGSQSGPLVLTVIAGTSSNENVPGPTPLNPLAELAMIAAVGIATAAIAGMTRRST